MADTQRPPGEQLHDHIRALPRVVSTSALDERAALAARLQVKKHNATLEDTLKHQIDLVLATIKPKLNGITEPVETAEQFILHERELRAIIAHSINIGAMQTAHGIGHALAHDATLAD